MKLEHIKVERECFEDAAKKFYDRIESELFLVEAGKQLAESRQYLAERELNVMKQQFENLPFPAWVFVTGLTLGVLITAFVMIMSRHCT